MSQITDILLICAGIALLVLVMLFLFGDSERHARNGSEEAEPGSQR